MTAALTLMAGERGDVRFVHPSMYYPSPTRPWTRARTSSSRTATSSAKAMAWFWDAYAPDVSGARSASPRRCAPATSSSPASAALVIVDEADVLRDEGEAYAARLRAAGVAVTAVRYDGISHDFMMLKPLSGTHATRAAVAQAIAVLRDALHGA